MKKHTTFHFLPAALSALCSPVQAASGTGPDWHIVILILLAIVSGGVLASVLLLLRKNRALRDEIVWRERIQAELADAKFRYQYLVDNLPQSVFWKDTDSRYVSVNKTFARLLHRSVAEVAGTTDDEYFPPAIVEKFRTDEQRIIGNGVAEELIEQIVLDKKEHWIRTVKTPLSDENGVTQGILGIFWDITEQKRAEDELRETQLFNESVMRSTLDIVYIYDLVSGAVVYINDHFTELLGFGSAEVSAMGSAFHCRLIHQDDIWLVNEYMVRCDRNGGRKVESMEFRVRDAVGRWLWFQGRYTVFKRNALGGVSQIIGTLHDITERVTVENALKIAFDRAQRYLDIVETIIIALDREGRITLVNRKGAQVFGYEVSELIGKNWVETCVPERDRRETAAFFGMLVSGSADVVEYHENRIITADNRELIIAWHNNVLYDDDRHVIGTLSAGEDITERKQAEALVKSEKLRQNMLITLSQHSDLTVTLVMDYALDTALVLTQSAIGYLYFYDEELERFTLYSWSNEVMRRCRVVEKQTMYELDKTGLWGEAVRQRQPIVTNDYAAENPFKRGIPEGHVAMTRHMNVPVFDAGGIVAVIGVANKEEFYDDSDVRHLQLLMDGVWKIKKRIELEEKFRRLNEELERKVEERTGEVKKAHAELTRFFTLTLDMLCIATTDGIFVRCNKAWEATLGYSLSDLEGTSFMELVHPDDMAATESNVAELGQGRDVIDFVNRYRCVDGSYRWIEWRSAAVGGLIYAAARDITDKKKFEEELILAKNEADRANEAKSQFLANISHEIRTPLNAVIGYSELLSTMSTGTKERTYIESISLAGRNLLRLINDLLDLSKIEAGMMTIRYGAVNIGSLLGEIGQIFSFRISEKKLDFSVRIDPLTPRYLVLDESRLRQVLLNLVGNAVKFTDHGFIKVRVVCTITPGGFSRVNLKILVEDSGVGIPEEECADIFTMFHQRRDQSPQFGGTGLGLSISKKLLELMNGTIAVSSIQGKGSTFIVELPGIAIASVAPNEEAGDWSAPEECPLFASAMVMVVDDIPSNRDMIATLLAEAGLTVVVAENGRRAVEISREKKLACIIMDIFMPVMDGIAAAKIIREYPDTAAIPIIALTTLSSPESVNKYDTSLFSGRLEKPVTSRDLFSELRKYLPFIGEENPVKAGASDTEISQVRSIPEEYHKRARDLLGAVKMDDIRVFAQDMVGFGKKNRLPGVKKIGKKLAEHADHFDISGVRRLLREMTSP